jgi:hypothetical protein
MTYVLILLVWVLVALVASLAFGAFCKVGAEPSEFTFPATQHTHAALQQDPPLPKITFH